MNQKEEQGSSAVLDFQQVGRIVDSVRAADIALGDAYQLPSTDSPAEWDRVRHARADLSSLISWAYTLRHVYGDWTSDSRAKRRYEALERVRRMARELVALIENDQLPLTASLASHFHVADERGLDVVDLSHLMVGLERLQEAARQERARLKRAGLHETAPLSHVDGDSVSLATPGSSFISRMKNAFEDGFGQPPSIKFTPSREPTGSFVRFVEAVTREMGEPMSPDGIRKAWDRAGLGQTSKKK